MRFSRGIIPQLCHPVPEYDPFLLSFRNEGINEGTKTTTLKISSKYQYIDYHHRFRVRHHYLEKPALGLVFCFWENDPSLKPLKAICSNFPANPSEYSTVIKHLDICIFHLFNQHPGNGFFSNCGQIAAQSELCVMPLTTSTRTQFPPTACWKRLATSTGTVLSALPL